MITPWSKGKTATSAACNRRDTWAPGRYPVMTSCPPMPWRRAASCNVRRSACASGPDTEWLSSPPARTSRSVGWAPRSSAAASMRRSKPFTGCRKPKKITSGASSSAPSCRRTARRTSARSAGTTSMLDPMGTSVTAARRPGRRRARTAAWPELVTTTRSQRTVSSQALPIQPAPTLSHRPQRADQHAACPLTLGPDAVLVQGDHQREAATHHQRHQPDRPRETVNRWSELDMQNVKRQPPDGTDRLRDPGRPPAVGDPDGLAAGGVGQLIGSEQHGIEADGRQVSGQPAGVVGNAVASRIEVAAQQTDLRCGHERSPPVGMASARTTSPSRCHGLTLRGQPHRLRPTPRPRGPEGLRAGLDRSWSLPASPYLPLSPTPNDHRRPLRKVGAGWQARSEREGRAKAVPRTRAPVDVGWLPRRSDTGRSPLDSALRQIGGYGPSARRGLARHCPWRRAVGLRRRWRWTVSVGARYRLPRQGSAPRWRGIGRCRRRPRPGTRRRPLARRGRRTGRCGPAPERHRSRPAAGHQSDGP